jgi:hypothetical protein
MPKETALPAAFADRAEDEKQKQLVRNQHDRTFANLSLYEAHCLTISVPMPISV